MVDFAALKKNRSKSLDKLNSQLEKISQKSYSDPNEGKFWKPTRDSAGNGFAIIRFLPAPGEEEMPFVRIWDHGFQGPTGLWYIENSLTTIGQDDPVSLPEVPAQRDARRICSGKQPLYQVLPAALLPGCRAESALCHLGVQAGEVLQRVLQAGLPTGLVASNV